MNPDLAKDVAAIRAQGGTDADVAAYLKSVGAPAAGPSRAELATRAGLRETQNKVDAALAAMPGYGEQVNRRLLALTDFVPGAHALIAGGRAAVDPNRTYADETKDIRESVEAYNDDSDEKWRRRLLKGSGALATGGAATRVAASVPLQGALLGAAGAAGVADADMSLGERAAGTAMGGAGGALLGKAAEVVGTGVQGLLATKPVKALQAMLLERAKAARALYGKAMAEGQANATVPVTREMDEFLNEPEIAEIVTDLRRVREFRGLPDNDPKILDAVVKQLSDRSGMLKKGQMASNPARPNAGRVKAGEVASLKEQGMDAISGPAGPMPTYITAVRDFAHKSRLMDAYRRGYEALRSEGTVGLPAISGLEKKAPEALESWITKSVRGLSESEAAQVRKAAADGVAGATKEALRRTSIIRPLWSLASVEALAEAPAVLRNAGLPRSEARTLFDHLSGSTAGAGGKRVGGLLSNY